MPTSSEGKFLELVVIIALAFGLAMGIQAWLVKPYQIPSQSMEPTLDIGQRILVNRLAYRSGEPRVRDVIVFHPPVGADRDPSQAELMQRSASAGDLTCGVQRRQRQPCPRPIEEKFSEAYVKRIVAEGGDRLSIRNGHPVVNGVEVTDEPFIRPCGDAELCNLPTPITVPLDHYFVMGDNRGESADSRVWGPIPRDWIVGKVFATYWPPDRFGLF